MWQIRLMSQCALRQETIDVADSIDVADVGEDDRCGRFGRIPKAVRVPRRAAWPLGNEIARFRCRTRLGDYAAVECALRNRLVLHAVTAGGAPAFASYVGVLN